MENINNLLSSFKNKQVTFAKGFDEAIIGYDENSNKMVYSVKKMILMLKDKDYSVEDVTEYLYYDLLIKDECLWHYDIAEGI